MKYLCSHLQEFIHLIYTLNVTVEMLAPLLYIQEVLYTSRKLAILTEVFRNFLQSQQTNVITDINTRQYSLRSLSDRPCHLQSHIGYISVKIWSLHTFSPPAVNIANTNISVFCHKM
jgi:hypothetical protein